MISPSVPAPRGLFLERSFPAAAAVTDYAREREKRLKALSVNGYISRDDLIWEKKDVLQVPASALFRKGGGWALSVAKSGWAVLRGVVLGHRNGLSAEVVSGVGEGILVIIHPEDTVRDGIRVQVRK